MNCKRSRDLILLSATGEAAHRDTVRLAAHLSACAECRAYQDAAGTIEESARSCSLSHQPSPDIVQRILVRAREAAEQPDPVLVWWPMLRRAIALAASLAIVAGACFYYFTAAAAQRIGNVHGLLALVSGEHAAPAQKQPGRERSGDALRALGARLLEWEGLAEDDRIAEGAATDDVTEWQEPSPTTLRSRSIDESAAEICG